MADVRLTHLLVSLCILAVCGCLLITRLGYVHVKVNWPEFRDVAEQGVQESAAFSDVALVRPPVSEKMTLVYVICENHFDLGLVAVKSAVAYSTTRLHLIIIADKHNEERMRREYASWPDSVKKRVSCDVMPVWFPKENYYQWWAMFRPCTTQRLFLTRMLPNEDAVLYVDTDVIFVHPIEDFWRKFYAMNEWQMAGMAPETENYTMNYYTTKALHPFVQPFALNAGLLMMNLTRMRAFDLENRVMRLKQEFEGRIPWADQDLLNIVFSRYPQGIFTFTCRWNFRGEHCHGEALCTDGPIAVVHASRKMVLDRLEPAFVTLHRTMQNFKLGQNLVDDFIVPLNESLQKTKLTGCTKELKKQLHLLRLSASRVDSSTAQAAATVKT
uniref:UDP-D-xylose:beta-D-glucoside alpha-1,3-D-xylosyltransferase n=1 Tax=Rhipicephalus pulchellus TaxID=72859 RepID=L7LZL4_RHIPC